MFRMVHNLLAADLPECEIYCMQIMYSYVWQILQRVPAPHIHSSRTTPIHYHLPRKCRNCVHESTTCYRLLNITILNIYTYTYEHELI